MSKSKMTKAKGYSLWLMPTGDVYRRLSGVILKLSEKHSTPRFEPHITLLPEIGGLSEDAIVEKTLQLSRIVSPFEIRLTHVNYLDQYFRCVFLRAEETTELKNANYKAQEIFGRLQDLKFMPHLSLMYGNLTPETKEQIIETIGREFNVIFNVANIHLFSTEGEPKDWHIIKEFELK